MSGKVLAITKRKSFAVVCGLVLLALAASCSPAPASLPVPTMTVVGDDLHPTAVSTAARASVFQQGVEVAQVPSLTPTASPTATLPPLLLATNTQAADSPVIQARVQAPVAVAQADAATLTPSPTSAGVLPAQPPPEQAVAPHQAVIHFDRHASDAQRKAYLDQIGATVRQNIDQLDAVVVDIPADVRVQALPTSDAVQASEPDYIASALVDSAPSDTYFADQWGLTAINAQQAWLDLPANPTLVKVAVIDSGVCLTHPDLAGHVLAGWDYVEQDATPQDGYGHGCGVAGIIAANIDNGIGIAGIAPNARILPLRVLDANGSGTYSNVAQAMVDATDQGAQVINLSLGGASPSSVLESAVAYALARGVTVVAAAGNNGANGALYPAKYSGVIAVGSMDQTLQPSSFSNYGTDIGLWAPGSGILSLRNGGGYGPMSGTSFAAPEVSGIAALDIALGVSLRANGGQAVAGQSSPPEATVDVTPTVTPTATATVTETSGTPTATVDPSTLVMVPGFEVSADIQTQTRIALAASLDRLPAARYYTISGLQQYDRWYFVSAVGLAKLDPDIGWKLDDATWTGLVLLEQHGETWSGAVEGSVAFSDLLAQIPDDLVSAAAKQDLDPRSRVILPLSAYRFPWDSGTSMLYGVEGLHDNGFAGVVSGWKAVDMLSDGNTASGHAPNRLRASAAGTIGYVCTPHSGETTTALKIGNVMYTHLQFSSGSFSTGRVVSQGEVLGQMRTGSFSENCGYASQGSSWFHVHWGFPNTGSFGAESWTLNFTDQLWHNGSQTRAAGSGWIQALWGASAPTPTKTPTPTPTPTRTPTPVPSLPANSNLIANGDFASGETSWKFSNISHSVKSGVLNTYRKSSSAGTAYQDIGYAATSGAGFELNLLLGNSSTKAKPVTISIRDSSGTTGQIQCTVTVPASSGLIAYRVRGLAGAAWAKIRVQLAPTTNDNTAALLVDNVNLQYKPSGLGAASCGAVLSADTPLIGYQIAPAIEQR